MWVADMDFRPPAAVDGGAARPRSRTASTAISATTAPTCAAITGWMARRHGWEVDPGRDPHHPRPRHGAWRSACRPSPQPGDGVILFTPVYHAFARVIRANGRRVVECAAGACEDGRYRDGLRRARRRADRRRADAGALLAAQPRRPGLEPRGAGRARRLLPPRTTSSSSPTRSTTTSSCPATATCRWPSPRPRSLDRLVMLTATTKTFNIAGALTGNVIVPDPALRERFAGGASRRPAASPNRFGMLMATAAYRARAMPGSTRSAPISPATRGSSTPASRAIPGRALDAAGGDLPRLGRLRRHRHDAEESSRPRRAGPRASPPSHGRAASAPAARASCASTSPRRAPRVAEAVARLQAAFADLQ